MSNLTDREVLKVVNKLIGPIDPIGETKEDKARLVNLKVMIFVVDALLTYIDDVAYQNDNSYEESKILAATTASDFYNKLGIVE